jgi:hypothetical protein
LFDGCAAAIERGASSLVDPVSSFDSGNSHRNEQVRRSLMPLVQRAAEVTNRLPAEEFSARKRGGLP